MTLLYQRFQTMEKIDLKPQPLARKPDPNAGAAELLALRETVAFMNNPEISGAQVPAEAKEEIRATLKAPSSLEESLMPPTDIVVKPKLFFTGRIAAGKDFVAAAAGAKVYGFADPLYALAKHFFGIEVTAEENKDIPGMRVFLQTVGQWGRGTINASYPLSMTRALFVTAIRSLAASGALDGIPGVQWEDFGRKEDIWLDSALHRVGEESGRVAITNVRFANEYNRLKEEDWQSWHVVCSTATWRKRLALKSLTPDSPQVKDTSEQLAISIDRDALMQIRSTGKKLRCIWNDPDVMSPSPRFFSVAEFVQLCRAPQVSQPMFGVDE
jgi:hypothetical protein